jgi:hypothetical protein
MLTVEKQTNRVGSDFLGSVRAAEAVGFQLDDFPPSQIKQSHWEERFWNPLAQAFQSEHELWAFLGNWDL